MHYDTHATDGDEHKMVLRRRRLLAAFEYICVHGDISGLTGSDVMQVLCDMHVQLCCLGEAGPLSWRRLADIQCQAIQDGVTAAQEAAKAAA